jgi:hypothetical protein
MTFCLPRNYFAALHLLSINPSWFLPYESNAGSEDQSQSWMEQYNECMRGWLGHPVSSLGWTWISEAAPCRTGCYCEACPSLTESELDSIPQPMCIEPRMEHHIQRGPVLEKTRKSIHTRATTTNMTNCAGPCLHTNQASTNLICYQHDANSGYKRSSLACSLCHAMYTCASAVSTAWVHLLHVLLLGWRTVGHDVLQ